MGDTFKRDKTRFISFTRTSFVFLLLVISLLFNLSCTQKKEYRLSVNVSEESAWGKGAARFAELVFEKSEGMIIIKPYYNMVLAAGDQMREIRLLQSGGIDFSLNSTINYTPSIPALNVFSLPFLFPDFAAVDRAVYGEPGNKIKKILEAHNIMLFGWGENGFRELTNRLRPIASPKDLEGIKVRVCSPIFIDIFKALNADPIAMVWAEALTAFRKGVVDGEENPVVGIIMPYEIYEYHPYLTLWHYSYDALMLCCNKQLWQRFTDREKGLLRACAILAMDYQKNLVRNGLESALRFMKDEKGVTITQLTPEQREAFKEKTWLVYKEYSSQIGLDIVEAFEKAVNIESANLTRGAGYL